MKAASFTLSLFILIVMGLSSIVAHYEFTRDYLQLWNLADKSSTIPAKAAYIQEFTNKLEEGNNQRKFASNSCILLPTANTDFRRNMQALETLATRLEEIKQMDVSSFQYNTAIEQITRQEQGEAHALMEVIESCYFLAAWPWLWGWIGGILIIIALVLLGWPVILFLGENLNG